MQLTYVFSDLATGLRRNLSMVISLVLTIAVSLSLFALGLLVREQVEKIEDSLGSRLQVIVFLCNQNSTAPTCVNGAVSDKQRQEIRETLAGSDYVESFYLQDQQEAYAKFKEIYVSSDETKQRAYDEVRPQDLKESFWITLNDPRDYEAVGDLVQGMPGVDSVQDLRDVLNPVYKALGVVQNGALAFAGVLLLAAIFQVANTIRLAAFARRREIGIMRLVGASSLYILMPFLLESAIAALLGILIAVGVLAGLMSVVVYGALRGRFPVFEWVEWADAYAIMGWIALLGLALALIPTLLMTRKYLKV
ncbi:MAG TPA: permease-like cell division protein FtsX [Nocardioidaceae bacterium]|nr:permease-like cell division protein FtsX [Nocardioidaceae bacterium]